ncbi:pyruvate dehydrogenase (acetyl-transferring), homodimeric type [Actinomycetospora termitidis]|uniref:Pyruvate dehydrogenase E1 component n=1 Tax=Actinomycetospora termitidis TaxID=3053470 RepID=A0ABT7MDK8_9PSEU|nr:pyruvate dehydrogenase (acetyl-transferring), homodimeric type [Actinomycetospora sp. Odt1-22]MDL5158751.1 pyruvate dehydrogenase (acetyl-transferring), homodimeric type [Actinomycetospora sp. Odt1-22]
MHPDPTSDPDPEGTAEWREALESVLAVEGPERAHDLLDELIGQARRAGAPVPYSATTPYVNTIPVEQEPPHPGDRAIEHRIRSAIRWNAVATVLRANKESSELGGHIASFQSAATLYDTGFQHFWHAPTADHGGDLVMMQGHSSPGIYARAFLEGRLSEEQMDGFRQETGGNGLSSYPHPWLMPEFWQFPTVSMGLGPLMAIYQARFLKYLHGRGLADTADRHVWAFLGDGEMDEPESLGAISLAGREHLDNLIFVVNCNLQRLDGPVRGNGKIIQELEALFRGAGWNVVKVIWGSRWDELLKRDTTGRLVQLMEECVDGEYQNFKSKNGAFVREHFFGKYPETAALVEDWTDDEIWALTRGGHDPSKIYAAYSAAVTEPHRPTVILAKTVKGYGMGEAGEGQNISHQQKKMAGEQLTIFRDRFDLPISDEDIDRLPYLSFAPDSEEGRYLREHREALGGSLPARRRTSEALEVPELSAFGAQLAASGDRQISTTMAFVRVLNTLLRDKQIGKRVVPIVPDESRTFGMEGMFRQFGIFSQVGQLYTPQDADQLMFYKEDKSGQLLQEGINELGAMSSWIAAATSYSSSDVPMIPFYIYYSMFGFQRVGDLAWAAGDLRARGFLLGGTAGRTTLNGEGLQHEDGHSHLFSSVIPNCVSYDPTFAYEVAVIVQDGLRRMYVEQEDVFYYLTLMNENYPHPAMPGLDDEAVQEAAREGIVKGLYLLSEGAPVPARRSRSKAAQKPRVQLMGSGTILREVQAAAEMLAADWGVVADVWSAPSFTELRRDGIDVERWNMLHPTEEPRRSWVEQQLATRPEGPVVAATDYMRAFPDQIRQFVVGRRFEVLGTDGFGRSDYRRALRDFFEVDRRYVVVAALSALARDGKIEPSVVADAIAQYDIDPERPAPAHV